MKKSDWVWLPHSAHLIVGQDCQFHLATVVGDFLVSTVGEWWPERSSREIHAKIYDPKWHQTNNHLMGDVYDAAYRKRFGFEEIGAGRTYETMVFVAKKATLKDCLACPYVIASGHNYDDNGYSDASAAYEGHLAMCEIWKDKTLDDIENEDLEFES